MQLQKRKTKLPQTPEMISHLSWRVIGTGDAGKMGFLSWSLHLLGSNQVKRKATFTLNQALCTPSNILGGHLSLQIPALGREGLGGGQTRKTHAVHLECICCKSVHASLQLQRSHQIRQKLLRIDQTQNN